MRKELGSLIFNESARRDFGMQVGDRINGFVSSDEQIVGFCADFNFKPLQYGVSPFAFYILPDGFEQKGWHASHSIYVRMAPGADIAAVSDHIRRCVAEVDPRTEPGDIVVRTFDEELGEQYRSERRLTTIVGLFALLAVVIALMGVFGLVLFETQYRRREIAVRRVMGGFAERNSRHVQPPLRRAGRRLLRAGRARERMGCHALAVGLRLRRAAPLVGVRRRAGGRAGRHGADRHRPLVACRQRESGGVREIRMMETNINYKICLLCQC